VSTATRPPNLPAKAQQGESFLPMLERSRPQIGQLVPAGNVDRVIRVARTAFLLKPEIQRCTPQSILGAVMRACELNLEPGGALQHAYLVPYGSECQFQLGYRGMLVLARRSGQFKAIDARVVHEGDRFEVYYDPEPTLKHAPDLSGEVRKATHAYAYARLRSGSLVVCVMSRGQIEALRQRYANPKSKMWLEAWDEAACKTVLRRLLKRQDCSVETRDQSWAEPDAATVAKDYWGEPADDEPDFAEGVSRPLYSEADDPDVIEPVPATATHRPAPQAAQKAVPSGDLDADDAGWDQGRE
jgi:recombination protein RecT